jgi:type VI secretion system secreted protein Hcp
MFSERQSSKFNRRVCVTGFGVALLILSAPSVQAQDDPDRPIVVGRVPNPPVAAVDMYIKFPGVDGESVDAHPDKWIDVLSIDWGAHKPAPGAGAQRRRGDVILEDVTLTKHYDAASPKILLACANGEHFESVVLEAPESSGARATYMKYELKNVMITSYSIDATGDRPMETITMTYQKVDAADIDKSSRVKVRQSWDRDE